MKRILIGLCLIFLLFPFGVSFAHAQNNNLTYIVSANYAQVYSEANCSSEVLGTLQHGDEIVVDATENLPTEEIWQDLTFYKVIYQQQNGYVLANLLTKKVEQIESIPTFNAKTNADCKVYSNPDETSAVAADLKRGTNIFLYEGYNRKSTFTAISFVQDGKVLYGYLKTKDVSPNGINPVIITCVVLILAVLGIIFAWLFMRNRKAKSAIKKQKLKSSYNLKN